MRISPRIVLAAIGLLAPLAQGEIIVIDGNVQLREAAVATPTRGMTMHAVEEKFGAPAMRSETVGQPPITRWDYPGFSVYFEKDRVIHAVVHG